MKKRSGICPIFFDDTKVTCSALFRVTYAFAFFDVTSIVIYFLYLHMILRYNGQITRFFWSEFYVVKYTNFWI